MEIIRQNQQEPDVSFGTELVSSAEGVGGTDTSQPCWPEPIMTITCYAADDLL